MKSKSTYRKVKEKLKGQWKRAGGELERYEKTNEPGTKGYGESQPVWWECK